MNIGGMDEGSTEWYYDRHHKVVRRRLRLVPRAKDLISRGTGAGLLRAELERTTGRDIDSWPINVNAIAMLLILGAVVIQAIRVWRS